MKIESIRGWMAETELAKADGCAWAIYVYPEGYSSPPPEGDIPVTIILRTPEAIEAMRERVTAITKDVVRVVIETRSAPAWYSGEIASDILAAIGITA